MYGVEGSVRLEVCFSGSRVGEDEVEMGEGR